MERVQSRKALDRARASHQKGDLAEAERLCLSILRRDAANVDALHTLGLLHAQRGRIEEASRCIDRALGLDPGRADLQFLRAELFRAMHLDEQALDSYQHALAIRPDFLEAHMNLGDLLLVSGRAEEALLHFDKALEIQPDYLEALNNRGNALQALRRHDEALQCYDQVLVANAEDADVLSNRANALLSVGKYGDAESSCARALTLRPGHVQALLNRGKSQIARGLFAEGLSSYDAALHLHPEFFDAWCDKGKILASLRRYREALESYDRALTLKPDSWHAWNDSGSVHLQLAQYRNALGCFDRALSLQPNDAMVWNNRGLALRLLERYEEAAVAFESVLRLDAEFPCIQGRLACLRRLLCDWRDNSATTDLIIDGVRTGKDVAEPLDFLFLSGSAEDQLLCARTHSGDKHPAATTPLWRGDRYRHDRIRVAYLSGDFRAHPTSYLLAGLFERHDRSRFETFAFSLGPEDQGEVASRVAAAFEHFIDVRSLTDGELASLLRRSEIDIAVDLMGYTSYGRIAVHALRPCPVQVSYLGYPSTTGIDHIDYLIADAFAIPSGRERHYAEKVVRLPDTFQANDSHQYETPRDFAKSELGLPEHGMVFCSFNKSAKITPEMFGIWMEIVRAVAGSVLWLWGGNASMQDNLRREAGLRGVDPSRLVFAPWTAYADHLARLRQADLSLDTLPFSGGATTSDALRAGVPVITCPGDAFAARMSGSLLHAIGMPELIAASLDEYKALAVRLGTDAEQRAATRSKLAQNRLTRPLFDTDRFRGHLEAAYEIMHARAQNGEPPAHFSVDPSASSARSTRR